MNRTLEVLADGFAFLEGPRWHEGRLWFSDMWGHAIHAMTEDGQVEKIADVPGRPSGLTFLPDGRLVAVSMEDRMLYVVNDDGSLTEYADLSGMVSADINDSVCDANGHIFVGNFGYDLMGGEEPRPAQLIRVDGDGHAVDVADDLMFPNGTVITPDGNALIIAETFAHRLTAFEFVDGHLSGPHLWADLGDHQPDGICLDAEGAIWVSSFGAGEFLRVIEGGQIIESVPAPGKCAVACNLGGADGKTLFALTFEGALEDIPAGGRNARIETCRVDVPGAGSP